MIILKENLARIFIRYEAMYEDKYTLEVLGHGEADPEDDKEDHKDEYYEMITETGFYIFFLISYYLELDFYD